MDSNPNNRISFSFQYLYETSKTLSLEVQPKYQGSANKRVLMDVRAWGCLGDH